MTNSSNTYFLRKCEIWLDRLKCIEDGEIGAAHPFIWIVYFKVDFKNVDFRFDYEGDPEKIIGRFKKKPGIAHFCDVFPSDAQITSSSFGHRNVGLGWEDGKERTIKNMSFRGFYPFKIDFGELHKADVFWLGEPMFNFFAPFLVGCVVILLEEDSTPNDVILAGAKRFRSVLRNKLDEVFSELVVDLEELVEGEEEEDIIQIPDSLLEEIKDEAKEKIEDKIKNYFYNHSNVFEWIAGTSDPDDILGTHTKYWLEEDLIKGTNQLDYQDQVVKTITWNREFDRSGGTWNEGKYKLYGKTRAYIEKVKILNVSIRGPSQESPFDATSTLYSNHLNFDTNIDRIRFKPNYTIKIKAWNESEWKIYEDPVTGRKYTEIDCSSDNHVISLLLNIVVDNDYVEYGVDVKIQLRRNKIVGDPLQIKPIAETIKRHSLKGLATQEIEIIPFKDIHRYEHMVRTGRLPKLGPPQLIVDAKISNDDVKINKNLTEKETEKLWARRVGVLGEIAGDPTGKLKNISISYHLGEIKKPVYIFINSKGVNNPITWTATLEKVSSNPHHQFTKDLTDFKLDISDIFKDSANLFTHEDYEEDNYLILTVTAKDKENQTFVGSFKLYAKCLIVKYNLIYEEFTREENHKPIIEGAYYYFSRYLSKYFKELTPIQKEKYLRNSREFKDDLQIEMNKSVQNMFSDKTTLEQINNKFKVINQEFVNDRLFDLKTQRNSEMLNNTVKQQIKYLTKSYRRKLSKLLVNQIFVPKIHGKKDKKYVEI